MEEFGFTLHKGAFCDALALLYGWQPIRTSTKCPCGNHFSVEHALSCPKGGFLQSGIIKSGTKLPTFSLKCATMYHLNQTYSQSQVKSSQVPLQTATMVQDWTLQQADSGEVVLKGYFLMSGFSIPTPHQTDKSSSHLATVIMRTSRDVHTSSVSVRSSMHPLPRLSCL